MSDFQFHILLGAILMASTHTILSALGGLIVAVTCLYDLRQKPE